MKDTEKSKKILMWSKVNDYLSKGLSYSQVSKKTGIDYRTVKRLSNMDLDTYRRSLNNIIRVKKLTEYENFIKEKLEFCSELSSANIEDKLKEKFGDKIDACSKTVFNYVEEVRKKYGYIKSSKKIRQMSKWEDTPYGEWAQVDFGSMNMLTVNQLDIKVYFMSMVLARSRAKHVYFQTIPFTSKTAIYAHQLAFEYFGGYPKQILYDNDSVFNKDQNCGDILLTEEFASYCAQESFKTIFCKIRDPQSKGKIENVVKFIKYNFLMGRTFKNINVLNELAHKWLIRTGNGKVHETTKLIPLEELEKEKEYLHPMKIGIEKNIKLYKEHVVLQDNTIKYNGNIYSLPIGTYKGKNTKVKIYPDGDKLHIKDVYDTEIAIHNIPNIKGQFILINDHKRRKDKTIDELREKVIGILGSGDNASLFLKLINKDKPRYFKDNLLFFERKANKYSKESLEIALDFCIKECIYNAKSFCEIAKNKDNEKNQNCYFKDPKIKETAPDTYYIPEKSNINTYQKIIK